MKDLAGLLAVHVVSAAHERLKHIGEHPRVRPSLQGALLRTTQSRRRDHLHGLGDLARVLHAAYATP